MLEKSGLKAKTFGVNFSNVSFFLQNPLLEGGDLSTMIALDPKDTAVDEFGKPMYRNRRTVSESLNISS